MSRVYPIFIMIMITVLGSCDEEQVRNEQNYVFLKEYCATVTVGGILGIAERCFEIGDVMTGYQKSEGIITIRIAKHSYLNDGPPSSASYQEYLDVPSDYLKLL
jgi:hypothetical protein